MHKDAIGLNIVQKPPFYWVVEWIFNTCCNLITGLLLKWNIGWEMSERKPEIPKICNDAEGGGGLCFVGFQISTRRETIKNKQEGDCWPFRDIAEFVYNTYYFSWTYVQESQCIHNNKLFSTYFFKAKIPKFIQTYYPSMWFVVIWYRCITEAISRSLVTVFIP